MRASTLRELSSKRRHEGRSDPRPYIGHLLYIFKTACREFEARVGRIASPRGAKTELVSAAIAHQPDPFRVADLQREYPGVSIDLIRHVLKRLRAQAKVKCLGRGAERAMEQGPRNEIGITGLNG